MWTLKPTGNRSLNETPSCFWVEGTDPSPACAFTLNVGSRVDVLVRLRPWGDSHTGPNRRREGTEQKNWRNDQTGPSWRKYLVHVCLGPESQNRPSLFPNGTFYIYPSPGRENFCFEKSTTYGETLLLRFHWPFRELKLSPVWVGIPRLGLDTVEDESTCKL